MNNQTPRVKRRGQASNKSEIVIVNLRDSMCIGRFTTHFYLVIDTAPDKDCLGRCKKILNKLIASTKTIDQKAAIVL